MLKAEGVGSPRGRQAPRAGRRSGKGAGRRLRRGLPRPGVVGQRAPGLSCCHVAAPRPQPHLRRDERRAVSGAGPAPPRPPAHWRVGTPVRARALASPAPRQHAAPSASWPVSLFPGRSQKRLWCPLSLSCTAHPPGHPARRAPARLCALGTPLLLRYIFLEKVQLHRLHSDRSRQAARVLCPRTSRDLQVCRTWYQMS